MQISVVIIAKNEAVNLKRSLPALSWCDDIVVVDDHSSDETASVAASFGARVFQRSFDGFGPQKRFAVQEARHDWVLNVDADEVLSHELITELRNLQIPEGVSAFEIPVRHVFMGHPFRYGKESRYPHLRLFDRRCGNFNQALVHEKVESSGKTDRLKHLIMHYSYRDLHHYFSKFNTYTESGARTLHAAGKSRPLLVCLLSFPVYFFKHLLVYGNIFNGAPGLVWSYLNAWYHTVKYLKLYEMNKNA